MFCPVCGSYYRRRIYYYSYKGKRETARIQYACANGLDHKKGMPKCSARPVHEHAIEGLTIQCLQETIYNPEFIKSIKDCIESEQKKI